MHLHGIYDPGNVDRSTASFANYFKNSIKWNFGLWGAHRSNTHRRI